MTELVVYSKYYETSVLFSNGQGAAPFPHYYRTLCSVCDPCLLHPTVPTHSYAEGVKDPSHLVGVQASAKCRWTPKVT